MNEPSEEHRDKLGRMLPGNPTKAPNWRKGQSGNPGGRPKGYVDYTKRLQNYLGREDGWEAWEKLLDGVISAARSGDPVAVAHALKIMQAGIGNDHALAKAVDENLADAPPPVAQLEDSEVAKEEGGEDA